MTPEQIRQIAEEYAEFINPDAPSSSLSKGRLRVRQGCVEFVYIPLLKYLNKYYCLVERSKVMQKYNELKTLNEACNDLFADDTLMFHWLFGTSMFNQDEE